MTSYLHLSEEQGKEFEFIYTKTVMLTPLIQESLFLRPKEEFVSLCNEYNLHMKSLDKINESIKEHRVVYQLENLNCLLCDQFRNFINTSEFEENKIIDYINFVEPYLNNEEVIFLLWTQDKRLACSIVVDNYEINITNDAYNKMMHFHSPHTYNLNAPDIRTLSDAYFEKLKNEFFIFQKNHKLYVELNNMPENDNSSKKRNKI